MKKTALVFTLIAALNTSYALVCDPLTDMADCEVLKVGKGVKVNANSSRVIIDGNFSALFHGNGLFITTGDVLVDIAQNGRVTLTGKSLVVESAVGISGIAVSNSRGKFQLALGSNNSLNSISFSDGSLKFDIAISGQTFSLDYVEGKVSKHYERSIGNGIDAWSIQDNMNLELKTASGVLEGLNSVEDSIRNITFFADGKRPNLRVSNSELSDLFVTNLDITNGTNSIEIVQSQIIILNQAYNNKSFTLDNSVVEQFTIYGSIEKLILISSSVFNTDLVGNGEILSTVDK